MLRWLVSRRNRSFRRRFLVAAVLSIALLASACWAFAFWVNYEPPNYSRIGRGLYMGGFVERPPWGTRAVLNLCELEDPYQAEVYSWQRIRDTAPAPNLAWLAERVQWIEDQRAAGKTVYIHCAAGVSRSGMVVVAYEMRKEGLSRDAALALVRTKRPGVRPHPVFMRLLDEWELELKKRGAQRST